MIKEVQESDAQQFIIGTEVGIIERMKREVPEKEYIPLKESAICKYMKMITLPKVKAALENNQFEITLEGEIRNNALKSLERMISIG